MPSIDDIDKIPYTHAVINEILRAGSPSKYFEKEDITELCPYKHQLQKCYFNNMINSMTAILYKYRQHQDHLSMVTLKQTECKLVTIHVNEIISFRFRMLNSNKPDIELS